MASINSELLLIGCDRALLLVKDLEVISKIENHCYNIERISENQFFICK